MRDGPGKTALKQKVPLYSTESSGSLLTARALTVRPLKSFNVAKCTKRKKTN